LRISTGVAKIQKALYNRSYFVHADKFIETGGALEVHQPIRGLELTLENCTNATTWFEPFTPCVEDL
jgi:hypothetical protein